MFEQEAGYTLRYRSCIDMNRRFLRSFRSCTMSNAAALPSTLRPRVHLHSQGSQQCPLRRHESEGLGRPIFSTALQVLVKNMSCNILLHPLRVSRFSDHKYNVDHPWYREFYRSLDLLIHPSACAHSILLQISYASSTAQGGRRKFQTRKPIGEVGCCESRMAERIYWLTERWLDLCLLEWMQWLQ